MRNLICVLVTLLISLAARGQPEAFPSTYAAPAGQPVLFKNATILTGDGRRLDETDLYIAEGKIQWVGEGEIAPGATEVDASGRWITPGLIDVHSHLGVYPSPGVAAHSDGNEATAPGHRRGVGRTQCVATRPWLFKSAGRRRNGHANSPGLRQPVRRPRRDP